MLPVGLDAAGEADLLTRGLAQPSTALLLGQHAAGSEAWLQALNPRLVLVSTAAGSEFPSAEALARLAGRGVLRTDRNGTVTLETDGTRLWVEAER
jgi:beta-lactamase superfamily II metal-dependent hydrolase